MSVYANTKNWPVSIHTSSYTYTFPALGYVPVLSDLAGYIADGTLSVQADAYADDHDLGTRTPKDAAAGDIPADSVVTADIEDLGVTEAKIAPGAVSNSKLGALAVSAAKIAALAVSEGKLGPLAVTEGKIGPLAVTTAKIAAEAVDNTKVAATAIGEFGNGGDGVGDYSASSLTFAKAEYNFTSLTIGAGQMLQHGGWWLEDAPFDVTIRCQSAIALDGIIKCNACAAYWDASLQQFVETGSSDVASGYPGGFFAGYSGVGSPQKWYPIIGGGCYNGEGDVSIVGTAIVGYITDSVVDVKGSEAFGEWGANGGVNSLESLIGPGKPFDACVGSGGSSFHGVAFGGNGGGIIRVFAPSITFGASGGIQANGGDGTSTGGDNLGGSGGGGGGYVEVVTRTAVAGTYTWGKDAPTATGDRAKCQANAGAGGVEAGANGFQGLCGLVQFRTIP